MGNGVGKVKSAGDVPFVGQTSHYAAAGPVCTTGGPPKEEKCRIQCIFSNCSRQPPRRQRYRSFLKKRTAASTSSQDGIALLFSVLRPVALIDTCYVVVNRLCIPFPPR